MAKLKGICRNVDGCDLAAEKVEQEAEKTNFVCSECGKPLNQVGGKTGGGKTGGGKTGGGDGLDMKKIIIGVAAVAVLCVGGYFLAAGDGDKEEPATEQTAGTDKTGEGATATGKTGEGQTPAPVKTSGKKNLGWAVYDGPLSGGQPHGIGGELDIKQNYSIDLKDGNGGTLEVAPGDKIKAAKFVNGVLKQGELHRANGERKTFII
ncbi:MAG: hypothetical protein IJ511_03310 [Bacteroides sp.]|nr:hypothetical protein [Bacteroides sp.]